MESSQASATAAIEDKSPAPFRRFLNSSEVYWLRLKFLYRVKLFVERL